MNGVAWGVQTRRNDIISTEFHCIKFSSCHRRRFGYHFFGAISHHLLSYLQSRVSTTSQAWARWIRGNLSWGTHQVQSFGYIAFLECCNVRYTSFHKLMVNVLIVIIRNEALRLQPPVPSALQRAPAIGSGSKALGPNMYESFYFTFCITARSST